MSKYIQIHVNMLAQLAVVFLDTKVYPTQEKKMSTVVTFTVDYKGEVHAKESIIVLNILVRINA